MKSKSKKKAGAADGMQISRDHWDMPVRVELRPYLRFCRKMDHELKQLVDRWAHAAAPNANRIRRKAR